MTDFTIKKFSIQCVDMCLLRLEFCENLAPQISQWKGFSPVCVDMCLVRRAFRESLAPQISQWKGFSPVCICSTMWVARQSRRFLCLFWRETRQRILGPEISPYPEVVRGRK